ncbi:MAG: hypothetical protein IT168_21900 [Bryobacterales bacterium]|nr:hypothetical protein [Bryobacterales bacterium]
MAHTMTRRGLFSVLSGGLYQAWSQAGAVKIERVETIKVVVPMKKGVVSSDNYGPTLDMRLVEFDRYPKYILKLHASNGMVGLGETAREVPETSVKRNAEYVQGKVLGQFDLSLPTLGLPEPRTADAFEIAIYDLLGKTSGMSVCALLGGCYQKKVAVSYWTGQRTFDDLVNVGLRAVELGFKNLKFKARFGDPIDRQLEAVAKACPNLTFIVDFNSSYPDVHSFLPIAHRLQGYKLTIEDPVPKRLDWFKQLRSRLTIPFALTPVSPQQMWDAIRMEAVDVFNLGGDMRSFVRAGVIAERAGIAAWHGSGVELGIRDMSFVHAAAATQSCTIPSDTLSYMREHDLLAQRFKVKDGFIEVPQKPGLGVDVDEDALKRFRVA